MTDIEAQIARVRWLANHSTWVVEPLTGEASGSELGLIDWAGMQPDNTQVQFVLSASNYSVHWVDLPGVSKRHLARAIPFALEESLIGELDELLVLPADKEAGKIKAYVVSRQMIEQFLELCASYHLRVTALIPETVFLQNEQEVLADGDDWLIRISGRVEGKISQSAVNALLESSLNDYQSQQLVIRSSNIDQGELLKTSVEVGFSEVFDSIQVVSGQTPALWRESWPSKSVSFLVGGFEPKEIKSNKPKAWFRPLFGLAAGWLLILGAGLAVENHNLNSRSDDIRQASINLYKQLFPGERIGAMERSLRSKLSEDDGIKGSAGGFVGLANLAASAYAEASIKSLNIDSMRFNERQNELLLEVTAESMTDLQTFQKALENKGLGAEVASANNEKQGVKGRLKVKGAA